MIKNKETKKSSNNNCDVICVTILIICILFMAGFFLYTNPEVFFKFFPFFGDSPNNDNNNVNVNPVSITTSIDNGMNDTTCDVSTETTTTIHVPIYNTSFETESIITKSANYPETSSIAVDEVSTTNTTKVPPEIVDIKKLYSATAISENEFLLTPQTAYENICSAAIVTCSFSTDKPLNLVFSPTEKNTHGLYEVTLSNTTGKVKEIMMSQKQKQITIPLNDMFDTDSNSTATIKIALKAASYTRNSGQVKSTREILMDIIA